MTVKFVVVDLKRKGVEHGRFDTYEEAEKKAVEYVENIDPFIGTGEVHIMKMYVTTPKEKKKK